MGLETIVIEASEVLLLMLLSQNIFIQFSCIVFFTIIHFFKVVKNVPFKRSFFIDLEHLVGSFIVQNIAVFRFGNLFVLGVVKPIEMFVVDVLDVDPFDEEKPFELE